MPAMSARRSQARRDRPPPNTPFGRYWVRAQRPLNALLFIAPFVLAFEVGISRLGTDLLGRVQIGQILDALGGSAAYLPALLVAVTLLAWHWRSGQRWRIDGGTILGMYLESLLLAMPLLCLGLLHEMLRAASVPVAAAGLISSDTQAGVLAALGAGVYEEFLFRLIGLNLLTALLVDVLELKRDLGHLLAVAGAAALFALYHFWGALAFGWGPFAFYFLAGCYLGGVYILRGFGIAVGTHVLYNLLALAF